MGLTADSVGTGAALHEFKGERLCPTDKMIAFAGNPNVGKSTLFNAITNAGAQSANYPFCTIEPNVGMVSVPDERLDKLAEMYCEPMEYLMKDPEDDEGNVDWEASNG